MIRLDRILGAVVELSSPSGSDLLSVAIWLIAQAQATAESAGTAESTAWVGSTESCFYPPDAAAAGVDLGGLAVVRLSDARAAPRAAARLLQGGGFGLVVLDLVSYPTRPVIPMPLLIRLSGLVRTHRTSLIVLTQKPESQPSIGSLVSLRTDVRRAMEPSPEVVFHVLKDKQQGPGAVWRWPLALPLGLRGCSRAVHSGPVEGSP